MIRQAILFLLVPLLASAAEWTAYRTGPFEIYTDRNQKQSRTTLNHVEQLRWAFSYFTGKQDPGTLWPIRIIVTNQPTSPQFTLINDGLRGFLNEKDDVPVAWNTQIIRTLIDDNLKRLPKEIEDGLIAVLSTTEVSGTHIIIGQPPAQPDLDWARMHYLMTREEYRSRVRVILANLNQGVNLDTALKNSLSQSLDQVNQAAQSHLNAAAVTTFDLPGKPLNASRDFTLRYPEKKAITQATSNTNEPGTAMTLAAEKKYAEASKIAPSWSLPYYQLSLQETDAGKKAGLLKKAAELAPRDARVWTEFAVLMMEYQRWADADQAWASAQRAAQNQTERQQIQAQRSRLVELRAEAEEQAKREAKLEAERDLQRVKNEAIARIKKAENALNGENPIAPEKVEQWWENPKGDATLSGTLTRVDCLADGKLRLVIQSNGKATTFQVNHPTRFSIEGSEQATLGCGVQRPARKVAVQFIRSQAEAVSIRFQ